jgi:uncharacterized short protein YbdD (DUF466 family)
MQQTTALDIDAVITEHNLGVIKTDSLCIQSSDGKEHCVKTRMHRKIDDFKDYVEGMKEKHPGLVVYVYGVTRYEANEAEPMWYAIRYALLLEAAS